MLAYQIKKQQKLMLSCCLKLQLIQPYKISVISCMQDTRYPTKSVPNLCEAAPLKLPSEVASESEADRIASDQAIMESQSNATEALCSVPFF